MEPVIDKLFPLLPRYKKQVAWVVLGLVISFLWFCVEGYCLLSTDDGNAGFHPSLDAVSRFMAFPASFLPGLESWDSQSHWMSFEVWSWYEFIGDIANCLLWGFFLTWLFRLIFRRCRGWLSA